MNLHVRHVVFASFTYAVIGGCSRPDATPQEGGPTTGPSAVTAAPSMPRTRSTLPADFTHARAFVFNRDPLVPPCSSILGEDGSVCRSARLPGVALSQEQMERAVAAFTEAPRDPDTAPWCFEPHHGIVLYDEAGAPVAAMSVCFECERRSLWVPKARSDHGYAPLSLHAQREFHRLLCEELQLTPCVEPGPRP